ncbi:hypothetical protein AMTR_s00143p00030760 [Amborella trichopoda]|uniref:Uncharacterized protein n=1 Tax=Amborella trichopoda TaxID=13333 RepID=W1P7W8_AMBTC|nr:hypothetical protein AMTR_s00143p00030760 [Amborella trichopoda]
MHHTAAEYTYKGNLPLIIALALLALVAYRQLSIMHHYLGHSHGDALSTTFHHSTPMSPGRVQNFQALNFLSSVRTIGPGRLHLAACTYTSDRSHESYRERGLTSLPHSKLRHPHRTLVLHRVPINRSSNQCSCPLTWSDPLLATKSHRLTHVIDPCATTMCQSQWPLPLLPPHPTC